jgi:predicted Zn-dependent protease
MFAVRPARRAIPQIREVPLTKEEIRRRIWVRRVSIATLVAFAVTALYLFYRANHRHAIDAAREVAERTGRVDAIERAIALLEGESAPGDVALAARLHATAVLAGVEGHRERAEALLAEHNPSTDGASDHRIADTYLALAAGHAEDAARHASLLVAGRGPRGAEAGFAIARARLASGNVAEARDAADAGIALLADAPRHLASLIEIAARGGGDAPVADGNETVVRIARARAAIEQLAESGAIRRDAQAVLDASDATPAERGWATLAVAVADAIDGDTVHAIEHLRADVPRPPGDELFVIEHGETLLDVGQRIDAAADLATLTSPVSTDAARRSLLAARLSVLRDDGATAARAVESAPDSPRRALTMGRVAALRGDADRASAAFRAASSAPALASYAVFELVDLFARHRDAPHARDAVEAAFEESPTHPRIAAAMAYALSAAGDPHGALTALGQASDAHPSEPLLLVARARVHARSGEWEAAYAAFQEAADATASDPDVCSERGQAARMLGHLDEARVAYAAALGIDAHMAAALVAMLGIELATHDLDAAMQTLARIDEAHLVGGEIDHLRARALVERMAGESGVARLEEAVGRSPDDAELRFNLTRLYMQAERWSDAADEAYAALSRTTDRRLALGLRAIALARGRRAPTVEAMLNQLRATVTTDAPLTPRDQAMVAVASGWVQWSVPAYGDATILARQALAAMPDDADATLLLAYVDENAHRDPSERLHAIHDESIEARGWLAALAATPLDAPTCADARAYVLAAPAGRFAEALSSRVTSCAP